MFKYVLSMFLFGGLIGGGLIGGCGEDTKGSPLPSEGEGQGEGEGEGSPNEGEGEGTEGEGEGPLPPGGDLEPCGADNTCQDGLECGAEEVGICTCPQWFGGRWWAEFTDVYAVDYEYDFTVGNVDAEFWSSREIELTQNGCAIEGPRGNYAIGHQDYPDEGGKFTPPDDFLYKTGRGASDRDEVRWITFTGVLSPDHRTVSGTCDGWYMDGSTRPDTFFRVQCSFTLTRR